jgi:O-antigen/teichoic acid export membrane protein
MVLLNALVILIIPKQQGTENTDIALIINLYFAFFLLTGVVLAFAFILKKQSWKTFSLPAFLNIRLLIKYALISLAANLIFFLVYRIDFWFVKKYCSANDLGNYIQVSKLGQMLLIVPTIISSVVFPQTASGTIEPSKMKENIMRIGRITSVLFIIFFVFILATGNKLFPFVFGATFNRMFIPFILLLPGIWALSNLSILSAYFGGVNKVKVNVQGAALALLFILIADYIFIPKFGMFAAALISTAGYALNFMYSFVILQREHEVSLSEYWRINKADIKWLKSITNK